TWEEPKSVAAEAYRILRTNLQFASPDERPRTILITSPGPGDGKSTITANLATSLAQAVPAGHRGQRRPKAAIFAQLLPGAQQRRADVGAGGPGHAGRGAAVNDGASRAGIAAWTDPAQPIGAPGLASHAGCSGRTERTRGLGLDRRAACPRRHRRRLVGPHRRCGGPVGTAGARSHSRDTVPC